MRAVFFDFGGTLMDQDSDHEAHEQLMAQVKRRFSLSESAAELVGAYHVLSAERLAEETARGVAPQSMEKLYTGTFVQMLADRGIRATDADERWFHDAYYEQHRLNVKLHPEARQALEAVSALGVHVGLISDFDPEFMEYHVKFLALEGRFDSVTTSGEAGCLKPAEGIFRLALKKAGVEPEDAVMVGDSLERDVDGALAVGMRAVLIDRHNARVASVPKLRNLKGVTKVVKGMMRA